MGTNTMGFLSTLIAIFVGCCAFLGFCLLAFLVFVFFDAWRQDRRWKRENQELAQAEAAHYHDAAAYIIRETEAEWAERQGQQ